MEVETAVLPEEVASREELDEEATGVPEGKARLDFLSGPRIGGEEVASERHETGAGGKTPEDEDPRQAAQVRLQAFAERRAGPISVRDVWVARLGKPTLDVHLLDPEGAGGMEVEALGLLLLRAAGKERMASGLRGTGARPRLFRVPGGEKTPIGAKRSAIEALGKASA